jgi:hypothetical protein
MKTEYTLARDTNGNRTLRIKNGNARASSIQTNGNLPRTHRDGIGEWTAGEVEAYRAAIAPAPKAPRSAWERGVELYAQELLESLEGPYSAAALLNGAESWGAYSYGGSALIYDTDIAERLCSPSELKRKRGGELPPSSRETWLDAQARALSQAARIVARRQA